MAAELIKYEAARRALTEARKVDEVKDVRDKAEAIRLYSIQAKDRDLEVWASEIRVRAERKAGELLAEMEKAKPRGSNQHQRKDVSSSTTLPLLGITRDQSSKWQKLAQIPEKEFEERIHAAVTTRQAPCATDFLKSTNRNRVTHSSDTDQWNTPPEIVARVVAVMRGIDLDPCAEHAQAIPAKKHFTVDDDGLNRRWVGRVYMNPPYGDAIDAWVEKLLTEQGLTEAIVLVPARPDTTWFRRFYPHNAPVCFIAGRLKFSGTTNSAPFPSAVFYLGPRNHSFAQHFGPIGTIFMPAYDWLIEGEDEELRESVSG